MEQKEKPKISKKELKARQRRRWVTLITIGTFFSTMLITYISDALLSDASLLVSVVILLAIILLGILSDIMGIAVASASLDHFNAMAARKIPGAKTCVGLVKNAAKVSSVCNDVIGDVCGIVSGATSVIIEVEMVVYFPNMNPVLTGLLLSGAVAGLTVGGKAFCKEIGMNNSTKIIHSIAKPIAAVKRAFTGHE